MPHRKMKEAMPEVTMVAIPAITVAHTLVIIAVDMSAATREEATLAADTLEGMMLGVTLAEIVAEVTLAGIAAEAHRVETAGEDMMEEMVAEEMVAETVEGRAWPSLNPIPQRNYIRSPDGSTSTWGLRNDFFLLFFSFLFF